MLRAAAIATVLLGAGIACAADFLAFEGVPGGLPTGWQVAATRGGPSPARWAVAVEGALTILSLVSPEVPVRDDIFNIAWVPAARLRDVDISVLVRADSGRRDQGGGVLWRAADANNYYVARFNPKESNFRIYRLEDGVRFELASFEELAIAQGEWFAMRIVHQGERIEGYINGRKLLEVRDARIATAGAVGLWTKSDAATSFADFQVREP